MTFEQGLIIAIGALAAVVGTLFKLLLNARRDQTAELTAVQAALASERQARYEFVVKKLEETEAREKAQRETTDSILHVTKGQMSGALPGPGSTGGGAR